MSFDAQRSREKKTPVSTPPVSDVCFSFTIENTNTILHVVISWPLFFFTSQENSVVRVIEHFYLVSHLFSPVVFYFGFQATFFLYIPRFVRYINELDPCIEIPAGKGVPEELVRPERKKGECKDVGLAPAPEN